MVNDKYHGKILLQKFDEAETERIKKIINKYDKRLGRLGYKELRLTLQRHKKGTEGKSYLNEIKGLLKLEKNLIHAEITSHEFYPAITKVMEKLAREAEHLCFEKEVKGKKK